MIKEIKPIQLGSTYDFIDLDKYTNNKDSIKIKFQSTEEEFKKWSLSDFGTIRIECGVIDLKQYENPYKINMIIEYEPSKLPLILEDIDTLEGLKKNITDLKSLDYISDIRCVAYRKFDIRLNEFVLFNSIIFDNFGQTWCLEYEKQKEYNYCTPDFLTKEEFKNRIERFSMCSGYIPEHDSVCPHCGQKWSLNNLRDCIRREDGLYHKECNKFRLYESSKKEFDYVASSVFNNYSLRAVKNEYGSENYNGSWFIINATDGDIKIGWRKRVIQIEWLENYKEFKFNGENEDVTKEFSKKERYIHAWNVEKAIDYLRQAKRTIIK